MQASRKLYGPLLYLFGVRVGACLVAEQLCRTISSSTSRRSPTFTVTASTDSQEVGTKSSPSSTSESSSVKAGRIDHADEAKPASTTKKAPRDPLNWFGILVPPALRDTQRDFTRAVTDSIPALAGVDQEMRCVEEDIVRVRRKRGIN